MQISLKLNMKFYSYLIIFFVVFFHTFLVYAKCDEQELLIIDNPESLELVDPSSTNVTMYDPLLDNTNVIAYKTHAKNTGNLGMGAFDFEVLIFDHVEEDNIKLCAYVEYGKLYETRRVGFDMADLNSHLKAKNFFELCPARNIDKRFPYYEHICNFWPDDGKIFDLSKKNKGTKGAHSNAVVYSSAKFQHNNGSLLECFGFGTVFNSNYPGYFTEAVMGKICTDQIDYFDKDKIKKIAQSIGAYGTAEPTKDLRLSFHK